MSLFDVSRMIAASMRVSRCIPVYLLRASIFEGNKEHADVKEVEQSVIVEVGERLHIRKPDEKRGDIEKVQFPISVQIRKTGLHRPKPRPETPVDLVTSL